MKIELILCIIFGAIIIAAAFYFFISKKKKTEIQQPISEDKTAVKLTPKPKESTEELTPAKVESSTKKNLPNHIQKSEAQLAISISSKTENILLQKLELFERNRGFIKKDISLSSLAKQFKTNTKYLSEIIKKKKKKQFNHYINELRIHYIVNKLKSEPHYINTKISYLASDCGFTSHSSFTTIFTQIMKESPSVFIKNTKEEMMKNS